MSAPDAVVPIRQRRRLLSTALTFLWLLTLAGLLLTAVAVVIEPLPEALRQAQPGLGLVVKDNQRRVLGHLRGANYRLAIPVTLAEVPQSLKNAIIAAEDARFYAHRGIDPLALSRAAWQLIRQRRIVSGASTISQQLARSVVPRPRTLYGKWREMVISLRIETDCDKATILQAYLNHVPFGPTTLGVAAAAEDYFGKPLKALSVSEACSLAALPRGPARYHPRRHEDRLYARRNQIIERLRAQGSIDPETSRLAQREPLSIREGAIAGRAPHFLQALAQGRFGQVERQLGTFSVVESTLDRELQAEVEKLVSDVRPKLAEVGATAAAAVVIDNETRGVLAYVGSMDFFEAKSLGQNDGCWALRQPGSALKPFVYAAGIEWLKMGPATQLVDVETDFETPNGAFTPKNYDGHFHGLVLLREALGASLNVPAVDLVQRVGLERMLGLLRDLGFHSLTNSAAHYGLALALGDGEVRLLELAEAYATLARFGVHRPLRVANRWADKRGQWHEAPMAAGTRVLSEATVWQILEILSDDTARLPSFGRHGTLELPFVAAVKTGTSSNHRDNWAVAVTHERTLVTWVGNFNGRPLAHGTSGVVGAAPLLRAVAEAAMRDRPAGALFPAEQLLSRRICKISGQRPGPDCPDTLTIRTVPGHFDDTPCTLHRRVRVDLESGLLAGSGCRDAVERVVEIYPDRLMSWARAVGRPLGPTAEAPRCPGASAIGNAEQLQLRVPVAGAKYLIDPHLPPAQQTLLLTVVAAASTDWIEYDVDGRRSGKLRPPFRWPWVLMAGEHRIRVVASTGATLDANFSVR